MPRYRKEKSMIVMVLLKGYRMMVLAHLIGNPQAEPIYDSFKEELSPIL